MSHSRLTIREDTPPAYDLDQSEYQYFLRSPERSSSFIIKKSVDGKDETFKPARVLGSGGFGCVRLFMSEQDSHHVIAVKNVLQNKPNFNALTQIQVDGRVRASIREIVYLAKVNPGHPPYLLKNFINDEGRYDNRILMPYFHGETLCEFVMSKIKSVPEFALLMLKVAQEVERVHQLGIYHGDLRNGNFLLDYAETNEFGMRSFTVRLIDFDHGGEIGKSWQRSVKTGELSSVELMLYSVDEGTDIDHLRLWMHMSKSNMYLTIPDADKIIEQHFPAYLRFVHSDSTAQYQRLDDLRVFIEQMTANLQVWEARQRNNSYVYTSGQRFFTPQESLGDRFDRIEEEWEAKRIKL